MGISTDWTEDQIDRLFYGGTMPEAYRDDFPEDAHPFQAEHKFSSSHVTARPVTARSFSRTHQSPGRIRNDRPPLPW